MIRRGRLLALVKAVGVGAVVGRTGEMPWQGIGNCETMRSATDLSFGHCDRLATFIGPPGPLGGLTG